MTIEHHAALPRETLAALLQAMIDNYRSVDGLWFQLVEKEFGTAKAIEIDEAVWAVLGKIEGRRVKQAMGLQDDWDGLLQAMQHNPSFHSFGPYRTERVGEGRLLHTVVECLAQTARLRHGQEEFDCQGVEQGFLGNFVAQFIPQATVRCLQCPPNRSRDDLWCQWMIEVEKDDGVPVPDSTGERSG